MSDRNEKLPVGPGWFELKTMEEGGGRGVAWANMEDVVAVSVRAPHAETDVEHVVHKVSLLFGFSGGHRHRIRASEGQYNRIREELELIDFTISLPDWSELVAEKQGAGND